MLPTENMDLITDPILHIILMYFLEARTNARLLGVDFLDIGVEHLLQLIVFKNTKDPLLLVGVEQNTLPIELVIIEFSNVGVSVRKSPLPKVIKPIAPVEPTLNTLQF